MMAQVLKRIVRSETPNVLIEDLKVFLDKVGDSIDLIGPDVAGKPMRSLEAVCRSISLDNLISLGHLTLWDENGTLLDTDTALKATNLDTIYSTEEATTISLDTSDFDSLLSSSDDTVQKAIDKLDDIARSVIDTVTNVTTNYTILTTDRIILCDGTITVTLPALEDGSGITYHVKNIGTGVVTIDGYENETIDGGKTAVMECRYESIKIAASANEWHIL